MSSGAHILSSIVPLEANSSALCLAYNALAPNFIIAVDDDEEKEAMLSTVPNVMRLIRAYFEKGEIGNRLPLKGNIHQYAVLFV